MEEVRFRLASNIKDQLEQLAEVRGLTFASLLRQAAYEFLQAHRHELPPPPPEEKD
jgi:predicted transcriptional regulator